MAIDWDEMLDTLSDMRDHFSGCAEKARENGRLYKTYCRYIDVIDRMMGKEDAQHDPQR